MGVTQIVGIRQGNGQRLCKTSRGLFVEPVARLNVVLFSGWGCAAGATVAKRGNAQPLKQIVGCAVFLEDHDHVPKAGNLGVNEGSARRSQQQDALS